MKTQERDKETPQQIPQQPHTSHDSKLRQLEKEVRELEKEVSGYRDYFRRAK